MNLERLLLGLLRHRTASGYDLAREIGREERHLWSASPSQVYATLRRLELGGLIESRPAPSRKGPPRRLYRLRPEGEERLAEHAEDAPQQEAERVPWLARVRILDGGDLATARAQLARTHAGLAEEFERLRALAEEAGPGEDPSAPGFFRRATLACAMATARQRLSWCEQLLSRCEAAPGR